MEIALAQGQKWFAECFMRMFRFLLLAIIITGCKEASGKIGTNLPPAGMHTIKVENVDVDLFIPNREPRGTVLVFPGWDYGKEQWMQNTHLSSRADASAFVLVLPQMGTTLYESEYFPETTAKWNPIPGAQYVKKLITEIQSRYGLLKKGQKNFLLGLSTGGRGVALTALENPDLFAGGAALSGDFAQEKMPGERITVSVYGPYELFKQRWMGKDNPRARVPLEWKMPIYISHGTSDRIVPPDQSRLFSEAIEKKDPNLVEYHSKAGKGHDYQFWDGELTGVFEFFEKQMKAAR